MGLPVINTTEFLDKVTTRAWWPPPPAMNRLMLAEVRADDLPPHVLALLREYGLTDLAPSDLVQLGECYTASIWVGEPNAIRPRERVALESVIALTRARRADVAEEMRRAGERRAGKEFQEALVGGLDA
jgi:hypothetical protein